MNSLNILSARVSPPPSPSRTRSNSLGNILTSGTLTESRRNSSEDIFREKIESSNDGVGKTKDENTAATQGTSSFENYDAASRDPEDNSWLYIPRIITSFFIGSIRWGLATLAAPGVYLMACLYDDKGVFAPFYQIRRLGSIFTRSASSSEAFGSQSSHESASSGNQRSQKPHTRRASKSIRHLNSSSSLPSGMSAESDSERDRSMSEGEHPGPTGSGRVTRSKSLQKSAEGAPSRRSISIKLDEDNLRQRKPRKSKLAESQGADSRKTADGMITPATLKSPTSPASSLLMTKYPRAPAPPRPLVPRRQPSYTLPDAFSGGRVRKTLIIDLDETLIHSMAKGGRMSTGHMVEVKLNTLVGAGNNASVGPQHPILYYVHKRPHCDDFLRRVCKWYNLVVFTASVQEYADPVIDWLEQERKFFSGRYYRQHCTYRHGAFIKDLSSVEPDLSKVMILDNSPLSYMFHQDNAIPIEGWINDPTDNDLLHLVPLLEGLQYVTDVRAFLALRGGEDGKHMVA